MTRAFFMNMVHDILELPEGSLVGDEDLGGIESWDSLSIVSVIAQVHVETGHTLEPKAVKACTTLTQLFGLIEPLALVG